MSVWYPAGEWRHEVVDSWSYAAVSGLLSSLGPYAEGHRDTCIIMLLPPLLATSSWSGSHMCGGGLRTVTVRLELTKVMMEVLMSCCSGRRPAISAGLLQVA